jgi:hypothetical protein
MGATRLQRGLPQTLRLHLPPILGHARVKGHASGNLPTTTGRSVQASKHVMYLCTSTHPQLRLRHVFYTLRHPFQKYAVAGQHRTSCTWLR